MRSIRIPWTAVLVVVLATVPAWTLPREPAHPRDDTEVVTGAGATAVTYDLAVRVVETTATPIPADPIASLPRSPEGDAALAPTPRVQSDAPEVRRRAQKIVGRATRLDEVIWSLYQYTAAFVPAADPPGPQDAVAVLAARRGTSLGRARTLTALLQAGGVPARLVG